MNLSTPMNLTMRDHEAKNSQCIVPRRNATAVEPVGRCFVLNILHRFMQNGYGSLPEFASLVVSSKDTALLGISGVVQGLSMEEADESNSLVYRSLKDRVGDIDALAVGNVTKLRQMHQIESMTQAELTLCHIFGAK